MDDFSTEGLIPHVYQGKVAPEDIDVLNHVNHATYLVYFEQARWSLLKLHGLTIEYIQSTMIGPAILEAQIKYQRELQAGMSFQIQTWAKKHSGKIGLIYQRMLSEDGSYQHSEINMRFGLMDLKSRRLIPISEAWDTIF